MEHEDTDIMARTIYGEARGEYHHLEGGMASLIAVGNVIMNRLQTRSGYGRTVREVCLKPWQFSCWNKSDPNRDILVKSTPDDPVFSLCQQIALKVVTQEWPDLTKGSNHYHALGLPALPRWARGQEPTIRLARHVFYQLKQEN